MTDMIKLTEGLIEAVQVTQSICTHDKIKLTGDGEYSYAECANETCNWFEEL